jgi:hypothetical protein
MRERERDRERERERERERDSDARGEVNNVLYGDGDAFASNWKVLSFVPSSFFLKPRLYWLC